MKPSVTVTLIIAGAALILAPYLAGYLYEAQVTSLLARPGADSVMLPRGVDGQYTWACLLVGIGMAAAAVRLVIAAERMERVRENASSLARG